MHSVTETAGTEAVTTYSQAGNGQIGTTNPQTATPSGRNYVSPATAEPILITCVKRNNKERVAPDNISGQNSLRIRYAVFGMLVSAVGIEPTTY